MIVFENGTIKKEAFVNIDGKEVPVTPRQVEGETPLAADVLNSMQIQLMNNMTPDGVIFMTQEDTNPAELFGGTWEKIRTFEGGDLIAYGSARNNATSNVEVAANVQIPFSDTKIPTKVNSIESLVDNILTFKNGTFEVQTKGIVGLIEADYTLGGLGGSGLSAIWFAASNHNPLPEGVEFLGDVSAMKTMAATFCGCTGKFLYKVNEHTDNKQFYINPQGAPYGGQFTPTSGGVRCTLSVKVYARAGKTNVWKRTSTPEYSASLYGNEVEY